jgi:hypothetical protein
MNLGGRAGCIYTPTPGCISCTPPVVCMFRAAFIIAASVLSRAQPFDSSRAGVERRQDLYLPQEHDFFLVPPPAIKRARGELRETIARPPAFLSIHYFPPVEGDLWLLRRRAEYFSSCLQRARPNFLCPNKSTSYLVVCISGHFVLFVVGKLRAKYVRCSHSFITNCSS